MNQRKAKRIRRAIYGDFSPRVRKYAQQPNGVILQVAEPRTVNVDGQMMKIPLRKIYQLAKKEGLNMAQKKKKKRTAVRSAKSGRYAKKSEAKNNPDGTVTETRK